MPSFSLQASTPRLSGALLVGADRPQRPADPGVVDVAGHHQADPEGGQGEVVEAVLGGEVEPDQGQDGDAGGSQRPARQPGLLDHEDEQDQMHGQGGQGQVQPPEAQGQPPDGGAHQGRQPHRHDDGRQVVPPVCLR